MAKEVFKPSVLEADRQRDKAAWSVEGLCEHYSLGRTKVFELLKTNVLKRVRVGRRTLITGESVRVWWESLQKAS